MAKDIKTKVHSEYLSCLKEYQKETVHIKKCAVQIILPPEFVVRVLTLYCF